MTTTRARVDRDFAGDGIAIHLAIGTNTGGTRIALPAQPTWEPVTDEGTITAPWLRIPDDLGRALLDALADHYGGTNAVRGIREDYLHERGRVDRLISALITGGAR